jgi:hypothetical protein
MAKVPGIKQHQVQKKNDWKTLSFWTGADRLSITTAPTRP